MISDYNSIEDYSYQKGEAAMSYRKAGFGVVNAHRAEGIHRGTSVLVALNDQENDAQRLIRRKQLHNIILLQKANSLVSIIPALLWGPWPC